MVTFSHKIVPARYQREMSDGIGQIEIAEYDDWVIDLSHATNMDSVLKLDDEMCYVRTEMGEVYFTDETAHVDMTMYDSVRLVVLGEMVYRELLRMEDRGCVFGLEPSDRRVVTSVAGMGTDDAE